MPIKTALPYGLRDIKITPYIDEGGTVLGDVSYDLPHSQTLGFNETEEFQELRGDDRLVATHGSGAQMDWSIEAGGIDLVIWSILSGGQIITSGLTPNRVEIMRKRSSDVRPYFRIEGQVLSDTGGDIVGKIYRARCQGNIGGDFGDAKFHITSCSGVGLPLVDDQNDLLYDIIRHETKTMLTTTPEPNPLQSPQNLVVSTITAATATVSWDAVPQATAYRVQKSVDAGVTWANVTTDPTTATKPLTGLTAATAHRIRVASIIDGVLSNWSSVASFTTLAS